MTAPANNFLSPAVSPARTDSSVAIDGNDDAASVISWADRCGKFVHQTMACLGIDLMVLWPEGSHSSVLSSMACKTLTLRVLVFDGKYILECVCFIQTGFSLE